MREAELWHRLEKSLGAGYARAWSEQVVLAALGGHTVAEAIKAGQDSKVIWRAVWEHLELAARER